MACGPGMHRIHRGTRIHRGNPGPGRTTARSRRTAPRGTIGRTAGTPRLDVGIITRLPAQPAQLWNPYILVADPPTPPRPTTLVLPGPARTNSTRAPRPPSPAGESLLSCRAPPNPPRPNLRNVSGYR